MNLSYKLFLLLLLFFNLNIHFRLLSINFISNHVKVEEYGDFINLIKIPKGTKILYIEDLSIANEEFEILFPRNIKLKLYNPENKDLEDLKNNKLLRWIME